VPFINGYGMFGGKIGRHCGDMKEMARKSPAENDVCPRPRLPAAQIDLIADYFQQQP
jgi:hypothetical protein